MRGGGFLNTFFSWLLFWEGLFSAGELSPVRSARPPTPPTPSVYKCWALFDLFRVSVTERMTGGPGLHSNVSFEWSLK